MVPRNRGKRPAGKRLPIVTGQQPEVMATVGLQQAYHSCDS